jgi:hypothetical protein
VHGALDRFRDDSGAADPVVAAALGAFAAAAGSEQDALTALADARLLVPVVAGAGAGKSSEMALPALVGADGRRALPVFTSLAAMARWQPSARPVPAQAAQVCRAAIEDSCAVIVDVAGPVPLAIEGARLAALAAGEPVPPPHADPDVRAAVAALAAGLPFSLGPGVDGGDLLIELTVAPMIDAPELARQVGPAVLRLLGARLRGGVALALSPGPARPA